MPILNLPRYYKLISCRHRRRRYVGSVHSEAAESKALKLRRRRQHLDNDLPELRPFGDELEAFVGCSQARDYMRDDGHDAMFGEERSCVAQVLMRSHRRAWIVGKGRR